ncbi:hypothetical protein ABPG77_007007 [Micractinium sp. CCAP 211/92]
MLQRAPVPLAAAEAPQLEDGPEAAVTEAVLGQLHRTLGAQQELLETALDRAERAERQLAEQRDAAVAAREAAQRTAAQQEEASKQAAAKEDALHATIRGLSDQLAALKEQLGVEEGRAAAAQRELRQARERAAAAEALVQQLQQQLYGAARGCRGWWWGGEAMRGDHAPPPPPPPLPAPAHQGGQNHAGWQPPPPPEPPPCAPQHCPSSSSDSDGWPPATSARSPQHGQQGCGSTPSPSLSPLRQKGGQPLAGPPPDRQPLRHLWVGNLPSSLSNSSGPWLLWQEFVPFGAIESVYVGRHPSRDDLGYAIVNFSAAASATAAMQALDDRAVPRLAGAQADGGAATPTSAGPTASLAASTAAWQLAVKLPGPEELHAVEEEEGEEALAASGQLAGQESAASPPLLRPSAQPFEPRRG